MRLRQPLPRHKRTRYGAMHRRWQECTPAIAAGLTDHVWTFRELLTAKIEPFDSQSGRTLETHCGARPLATREPLTFAGVPDAIALLPTPTF
jgi:hypothetical protein